ncbi:MAG: phenylalanine--tRNA ligase subunit alpha [Armatimonadota bacterium]|nr:MAG: phenylalanine--tRNA ligase subunit alpha [Armatimonadota bacterium]
METRDRIRRLHEEAVSRIVDATSSAELEQVRVDYLGRKGALTGILRGLADLPPADRPGLGKMANEVQERLRAALDERAAEIAEEERQARLAAEALDVTLPGRHQRIGHRHPLTQVFEEMKSIFVGMGFEVVDGPEVEYYRYNFEALNYPEEHPAMDEQDSFYVADGILLRTQTSPMQIRVMEEREPPLRIIAPGKVYRREAVSVRLSHTFHQLEGYAVDRDITFADLKGTLALFVREFFGAETDIQFRADFFPFTEPSADYSVSCGLCEGSGCAVCKHTGWLEIGGCGLIHPNVLSVCGYDPEQVSGWAFGLGVDRIAMRRYGIEDIRLLVDNDMRFLEQF